MQTLKTRLKALWQEFQWFGKGLKALWQYVQWLGRLKTTR